MLKMGADTQRKLNAKEKQDATREWLEKQQTQHDDEQEREELESIAESSVVDSESSDGSDDTETDGNDDDATTALGTQIAPSEVSTITESIKTLLSEFNAVNSVQTVGNVKIENSTGVHIGNITNIGNIQIIQAQTERGSKRRNTAQTRSKENTTEKPRAAAEEREEKVQRDAFQERIKFKIPKQLISVIPRRSWLAQRPMEEPEYLQEPVEYVVISHTATESSEKQAINISIIRDIQCFHIESREWNDIAYNFLVGCDANIYEGRGWGVIGAHTMGYNTRSIGITFIGCFMRVLPTAAAIQACKNFLKRGVEEGHLAADYKLICHCQCRSTESPGRKLFEDIQQWEHFYNIEDEVEPEQ